MWLENIHVTRNPFSKLELWPFVPGTWFSPFLHWSLSTIILFPSEEAALVFQYFFLEDGLASTSLQHSLSFNHFITNNIFVSAIPLEAKASRKSQLLFNLLKFSKIFAAGAIPEAQWIPAPSSQSRSAQMQTQNQTLLWFSINVGCKGMHSDTLNTKRVVSNAVNPTLTTAKIWVVLHFLIPTHFLLSDVDTAQLCCWQSSSDQ